MEPARAIGRGGSGVSRQAGGVSSRVPGSEARPRAAATESLPGSRVGFGARIAVAALGLYKRFLSPLLPNACRFTPSCSVYAREAILKYGLLRGSVKAMGRLLRCHPFHPGGVDEP